MKSTTIRNIVHLGEVRHGSDRYRTEYLKPVSKQSLERDWYGGLYLFLSDAFYQGRLDAVSERVEGAAMVVLDKYFRGRDISALRGCDFASLKDDLLAVIGKGKVGKGAGRPHGRRNLPVRLAATRGEPDQLQCRRNRGRRGIHKLSGEFQGITGIGPKIASLYLRDLVDIYDDLESKIAPEDLPLLQPIDVWVRRVAYKAGIVGNEQMSDVDIQKNIVRVCRELGVSALRFNQGAWYLGKNAFEILLETLDRLSLSDSRSKS
jgi:hypothetical protein